MKLSLHNPISHTINLEFKNQSRAFNPHIEREIQVIKLDALRRRQAREQGFGNRVQVRGKCAHVDEALAERVRSRVGIASNEVVFDDERLAWPEIARVVE